MNMAASEVIVWSSLYGAGLQAQQSSKGADKAAARGSLWASRPVTSHTNEGLQGARPDSQQRPLGPTPVRDLIVQTPCGHWV